MVDDAKGKDALTRALNAGLPASVMDARAATILQTALTEQQAKDARDKAQLRVIAIHAGCFVLLAVAVVLKVTLLKSVSPIVIAGQSIDLGTLLIMAALWVWGQFGFPGSKSVLALTIAKLEPAKLDQLLSMRPPTQGNALSLRPPAPTTPTKEPAT